MGLLSEGTPFSWADTKKCADFVREHGIAQFIIHFHRLKERDYDTLKWGDEIEYMIVHFDHENKKATVRLRAAEILRELRKSEDLVDPLKNEFLWRPEYAEYMIEGTPGMPYSGQLPCFTTVQYNMKRRRQEASKLLKGNESIMSIPNFPRLGCPSFTSPELKPTPTEGVTHSLFFPDGAIFSDHPRFRTLSRNIRERRGRKVVINVPIYRDTKTPKPFREDLTQYDDTGEGADASRPNYIYMDAMGFGMGCCCLQVTFQACNVNEARFLYDQLTPITPIILAISAATPIFRGYLADVDCRWNIISAAVDDRTYEEMGLKPLVNDRFRIHKSRYDTTDSYLYQCSKPYNDINVVHDKNLYDKLIAGGVDDMLALHIAHLFIRDPVQLYAEDADPKLVNDEKTTDHFESIQSTNWMNMRFKLPPPAAPIGWRVEFRPAEVQLTDFENAAFVTFVVLLTRVIMSFRLSMLIPISKVNENMERAQKRDAVLTEKFYFRPGVSTCNTPPSTQKVCGPCTVHSDVADGCPAKPIAPYTEMTIHEIISGKKDVFPGLVNLIWQYLDSADVDVDTRCTIEQYLRFIQKRASGELLTLAKWQRNFVQDHSEYKQDSVVNERITYDMLTTMNDITNGKVHCEKLLGNFATKDHGYEIPDAVKRAETLYEDAAKELQKNGVV